MARKSLQLWASGAAAVAFVLGSAASYPVPFEILSPGSADPIGPLLKIEDDDVRQYPAEGQFLLLTVSSQADYVPVGKLVYAWFDPKVDVIKPPPAQANDPKGAAEYQVLLMDESRQVSAAVALRRLNYDVTATGSGADVKGIVSDGPSAKVLRPDDVITSVNGKQVSLASDLVDIIGERQPGDVVTLAVTDAAGASRTARVTLGTNDLGRPYMGVGVLTKDAKFKLPFRIKIDSGDISGPSGGLGFTLSILDHLSPGELTGGQKVAVTGTMNPDGSVGAVGGVGQKIEAARKEGVTLFLVPANEFEVARARAGSSMKVVAINNLDDALEALEDNGGDLSGLPEPLEVTP